ncbi:hypothetical protein COLO4_11928 [Corchorus olitorius]|uniref:F-box associated beta-propeller type 1 domain-containing protein n=1 Tax=Corchorus olitorius TaxID=93759 RepID=A0A1R3K2Q4_9ROSI|nr:hypothetical protein COLO4_11928 [Corchorus olitorius]
MASSFALISDYSRPKYGFRLLAPDKFDVCLEHKKPFDTNGLSIVGSCNGLHKLIPDESSTLTFHPNNIHENNKVFGFGYDSRNNDYKVVRVHELSNRIHGEVFSLGKNSWRNLGLVADDDAIISSFFQKDVCFLNGAIHKLVCDLYHKDEDNVYAYTSMLTFDVGSEIFQPFPLPDCVFCSKMRISVNEGLLCILDFGYENEECDIWVMQQYAVESSWTRLYSIRLVPPTSDYEMARTNFSGFGMNGELMFVHMSSIYHTDLIMYHPDNEEFKYVDVEGDILLSSVVACRESLVSLEQGKSIYKINKCKINADEKIQFGTLP